MTITTRVGMPLEEFLDQQNEQPFDLIDGERILLLPTLAEHNELLDLLYNFLKSYAEGKNLGIVRMEATIVHPDRYDAAWVTGSRTPDILFINATRFAEYKEIHPDWRKKPYLFIPDLVVEVVSSTDRANDLEKKIEAYRADGVRLLWVIYPQSRKIHLYTPDHDAPTVLKGEAILDGGDVLPGFKIALSTLFE